MTNARLIEKIDRESEKCGEHGKLIAQHLIDLLSAGAQASADAPKKSLSDCLKKISERAHKKAKNNVAVIADSEVYSWAREFYGLKETAVREQAQEHQTVDCGVNALDVDLFDLL